eukprot:4645081-Amphidinium_carterae.1
MTYKLGYTEDIQDWAKLQCCSGTEECGSISPSNDAKERRFLKKSGLVPFGDNVHGRPDWRTQK